MPIYVYVNINTGEEVSEIRRMRDRNNVKPGWIRKFVNPIGTHGMVENPNDGITDTRRMLYDAECNLGRREVERQSGFPIEILDKVHSRDFEAQMAAGGA